MRSLAVLALMFAALATVGRAQALPDKIRGYKVENVALKVSNSIPEGTKFSDDFDLYIQLTKPKISMSGLLSASINVGADIVSTKQSGEIAFVSFHDVRVNGIAMEIDEYTVPMKFKKGIRSSLPKPVTAKLNFVGAARGAFKELTDSRNQWRVTGTAFVFGQFKKFGFSFKRVVPIKIDMLVKNPLL
ncbi:MAG: hypothetical protein IPG58_18165 [Acidobacteria bacterium]|nr:hypothetical protein [Acidobacteriota bacterium]